MYKVIVKHRSEYNTPVKVYVVDNTDEANDIMDMAKQQFAQGIVLTDEEFKELNKTKITNE